jgi:hypothetical protein
VDSGFKHLQSIKSCGSSSKATSNCSIQTKTNVRFEAMKHLLLTAPWLLSAANVLEEYIKVIGINQSICTLITKKSQHLKKHIVPMISYAANSVAEISKSLAPIPSVNYVHHRMEVKRKSDIVNESSKVVLVLTCNLSVIRFPTKRGRREVTTTKLLLRRRSSGYCHVMIDTFHQMMTCYLCPLMDMSIESRR